MSMYCEKCGGPIKVGRSYCQACGSLIDHKTIIQGNDGVYRWTYGLNMWKNPTLLITVWKVFLLASMFPTLLLTGITLFEEGLMEALSVCLKMFALVGGIATGLVLIAYPITALINGGTYQVVFEMDDEGIRHIQMQKQFQKNQVMAMITSLAGVATGNPGVVGAGLLASAKQSTYSKYKSVTKIKAVKRRHVIYINSGLEHNQIYIEDNAYDYVLSYISSRCEKVNE